DFLDYDTDSLTVSVKGGPEDDFAIGSFEITIKTTSENFGIIIDTTCTVSGVPSMIPQSPTNPAAISITNNWQDDGSIIVAGLPPLEYNVSVYYRGNGIPAALDSLAQNPFDTQSVSIVDTTDIITFNWRAPMNINLAFSDTLQLQHFPADTVHTFYVLHQNEWAEIEVQVSEDYSCDGHPDQVTCLNDCALTILDEVGTTGETETAFEDTTIFTYIFAPYLPNMLSGCGRQYQKKLEFTANDTDLNRFVTQTVWVLTEGVKPTESTYATTSPEIPIMILHDPPGDGSFTSFTQSSSHSIGFGTSVCTDSEHNIFANIHLGPDITIAVGTPFFSVESEIDITADFDLGLTMQKQQTQSMEHELTFSTSEEYTTSEEDQVIGDGADVFVGGAMNLIWGVTNELSWNDSAQTVIIDTCVMVTPDGFATVYIYTDNQIRNTVIPNLETIGDTLSAALWNTFLVNNENNKANAVLNPNHPDNLSFNAGAGYTYEEETSTTQTQTIEFESTVSAEFGAKIGMTVDGIGGEFGYTFRTGVTLGTSSSVSFETTSTTTFVLADDDETSDLNEIADYFSVNIKEDPVYGTPVFNLLSGATSCPWEPNTLAREGVSFSAESNSALNLPEGTIPAFILNLGNTSQTDEDRRYYLKLNNSSNPGGATIKINGVTIENMMQFDVPAGEAVQAVMTVEQGPVAYEYYDIELKFFSLEDENNDGPEGHYFEFVQLFDISWEPPYSQVQFDSPQDNWLINSANDDTMMITLSGYDITKPHFDCLKMQYKHPGDENWNPAFTIPYDTLLVNPYYIDYPWVVDNLTDGSYLIRAAAYDSIHAPYYTDNLTGLIDRQEPAVVGLPTPIDGILNVDDQISVSYTESIDPNMLYLATIIVTDLNTQDPVPFVAQAVDNQLIITLTVPNQYIENDILNVSVQNIYDLYGNCQTEETEWEMYVNRNPVGWNTGRIEVIKAIGTSLTISAGLINSGGYTQSYVITDYPDSLYHPDLATHTPEWLSASPFEGQLVALDQQTIEFDISNQIGFGVYQVDLVANTSMGNEILEIEVNVLSNPPVWATNPIGNFDYSMTITGQLLIEGEISTDVNDIIGAFILNGTGEYECRGYASTKLVPYFQDVYQFYLTIHSDVDYGDDIIFRVWDASTNKEHYGIAEQYTFMAGAIYGTPVTPEIIHVSSDLIQTIQCNNGWSWISTNLLNAQTMAIDFVLSSISPQQNDFIKNQTEYAQFTPGLGW
ncbi:MAG: hypothetical protein KAW88_01750, partial [Candidatus Cloacimonetes bacterium]|nr:hypothetical protein [Candidatus Cloacimonadota bacterium]